MWPGLVMREQKADVGISSSLGVQTKGRAEESSNSCRQETERHSPPPDISHRIYPYKNDSLARPGTSQPAGLGRGEEGGTQAERSAGTWPPAHQPQQQGREATAYAEPSQREEDQQQHGRNGTRVGDLDDLERLMEQMAGALR